MSPIVSVRTPTGRVERKVSPLRLAALILLAVSLISAGVYWFTREPPPTDAQEPLF